MGDQWPTYIVTDLNGQVLARLYAPFEYDAACKINDAISRAFGSVTVLNQIAPLEDE